MSIIIGVIVALTAFVFILQHNIMQDRGKELGEARKIVAEQRFEIEFLKIEKEMLTNKVNNLLRRKQYKDKRA